VAIGSVKTLNKMQSIYHYVCLGCIQLLLATSAPVSPEPPNQSRPWRPFSPAVAKSLVFTFYAMVVLCAWAAHASWLPPLLFASQSPLESPALSCLLYEFMMLD